MKIRVTATAAILLMGLCLAAAAQPAPLTRPEHGGDPVRRAGRQSRVGGAGAATRKRARGIRPRLGSVGCPARPDGRHAAVGACPAHRRAEHHPRTARGRAGLRKPAASQRAGKPAGRAPASRHARPAVDRCPRAGRRRRQDRAVAGPGGGAQRRTEPGGGAPSAALQHPAGPGRHDRHRHGGSGRGHAHLATSRTARPGHLRQLCRGDRAARRASPCGAATGARRDQPETAVRGRDLAARPGSGGQHRGRQRGCAGRKPPSPCRPRPPARMRPRSRRSIP